jgi:hypothetical protein
MCSRTSRTGLVVSVIGPTHATPIGSSRRRHLGPSTPIESKNTHSRDDAIKFRDDGINFLERWSFLCHISMASLTVCWG